MGCEILKNGVLLFLLSLAGTYVNAQGTRGLYVDHFRDILGNSEREEELLVFARDHGFNYLAIYDLSFLQKKVMDFTCPDSAGPLRVFMRRARTEYGITQIGAIGESFKSFKRIELYHRDCTSKPEERFNVYNIEFEFWNDHLCTPTGSLGENYLVRQGYSCDSEGAFAFYLEQLRLLDSLTTPQNILLETYIGWTTREQSKAIAQYCDRVLVHYYRPNDLDSKGRSIYNLATERVRGLGEGNKTVEVMPIFSAEPEFMGPWLANHPFIQAYHTWDTGPQGFDSDLGDWKNRAKLSGFQWFKYSDLKLHTYPPFILAQPESQKLSPGETALLQIGAYGTPRLRYMWYKNGRRVRGAKSNTLTVKVSSKTTGRYICKVKSPYGKVRSEAAQLLLQ